MKKLTYSRKKYLKAMAKFWGTLIFLIVFLYLDFHYGFNKFSFTLKTFESLFAFFLGFFFYPLYKFGKKEIDIYEDKILNDADHARLGFEGEDTVENWLKQILPEDKYTILTNVVFPESKFDVDFVVIGPKGVIVLEAKNFTGQYEFIDDKCFRIKDNKKFPLTGFFDPRKQVERHARSLIEYLNLKGFSNLRILKALVVVDEKLISVNGSTGIYVCAGFDSLKKFLESINNDLAYTPVFCEKLVQAFSDSK